MEMNPKIEATSLWTTLGHLTATRSMLEQWQDRRFQFAFRVGQLLAGSTSDRPAVTGPALYGVYLSGAGLVYVGQTLKAQRRLRDLPVGESHHIATTVPPEIWERVVVVQWTGLLPLASLSQQNQVSALGPKACGLALEHILQVRRRPLLNARSRTSGGQWRQRDPERSQSIGAINAANCAELFKLVEREWEILESIPASQPPDSSPGVFRDNGRAVFPRILLNASR